MAHYSRIQDYTETQNGLLKRRGELFKEAEAITERLAEIKNDIKAFDKTLRALDYKGDLDAIMPRQRRNVIFGQGELLDALMLELRHAERPMRSRELAQNVLLPLATIYGTGAPWATLRAVYRSVCECSAKRVL